MKKIIALMLCLVTVFCAAACDDSTGEVSSGGGGGNSTATTGSVPRNEKSLVAGLVDVTEPDEIEKVVEGKTVDGKGKSDAVKTEQKFLEVFVASTYDMKGLGGDNKNTARVEYPIIKLGESTRAEYPALAKTIDSFNAEEKADAEEAHEDNLKIAEEMYEFSPDVAHELYYTSEVAVKRADKAVLSLQYSGSSYTGGAHGNYGYYGRSIDVKTGKVLTLADVVTDVKALPALIKKQLELHWGDVRFFSLDTVDEIVSDPDSVSWSLDYGGLTFYYNPYHLASYADGAQIVTISFKDNPGLFKPEYVSQHSEYVFQLDNCPVVSEDVTGDGVSDKITFAVQRYEDDASYIKKWTIGVNGNVFEDTDVHGFEAEPMFVRTEHGCYFYVECPGENGYTDIHCYRLGNTAKKIGIYDGGIAGRTEGDGENMVWYYGTISDPDSFRLEHRAGRIGTYFGAAEYHVGEDGMPETYDPMFVLNSPGKLTLLCDIEGDKYDLKTNTTYGKITMKKGETVTYYATDDKGMEFFKLKDGTVVRVTLDPLGKEFIGKINGVSVWEIFDNICLAG